MFKKYVQTMMVIHYLSTFYIKLVYGLGGLFILNKFTITFAYNKIFILDEKFN